MGGDVEDRTENQHLLDEPVGLEGLMSEHAVITDRRTETAEGDAEQRHANNLEARHWEEDQAYDRENVNENEISEDAFFSVDQLPERPVPGALLLRYGQFHVLSGDLLC